MGSYGYIRVALMLALAVGGAMLAGCKADTRLTSAPIAVVLSDDKRGTRLTAVDLSEMDSVASRRLRSECYSMDGDPKSRVIVTAQTGGVGPDADDAAGVWNLRSDEMRYVSLPYPNPSSVAVAHGIGYVMHGFQIGDSLVMSAVSLALRDHVTTGTASEWAQDPTAVEGALYLPVSESPALAGDAYSKSSGSIERLSPSMEESRLVDIPRRAMQLVADPVDARNLILVGSVEASGSESKRTWHISRINTTSGQIVSDRVLELDYGVASLCTLGADLAIADSNGVDLDDPGRTVVILDGRTLAEKRRVEVSGTPAAVAQWRGRLLVYDGLQNELLLFGPTPGSTPSRLALAGQGMGNGDIVVFDSATPVGE